MGGGSIGTIFSGLPSGTTGGGVPCLMTAPPGVFCTGPGDDGGLPACACDSGHGDGESTGDAGGMCAHENTKATAMSARRPQGAKNAERGPAELPSRGEPITSPPWSSWFAATR